MKGGKGGQGRKRLPAKPVVTKVKLHEGPKRGASKRDWGAVDREDPLPPMTVKPTRRPTSS